MRLSKDLLVAVAIHRYQPVTHDDLVGILKDMVDKAELPRLLRSLDDWGITTTEYRFGGRIYMINLMAQSMIRETRELWEEDRKRDGSWWWKVKRWLRI